MGLPWHGVVHRPDAHSDRRNYHMHLHYHDRPVLARRRGAWGFAAQKAAAPRARGFIKQLRTRFAEVVNGELERAGLRRRWSGAAW